jgi:predicted TIM-barrel fold metal-dependent hydrolase
VSDTAAGGAVIDVGSITAIDVHVHTELTRDGHDPLPPELRAAAARYFRSDEPLPTVDDVAAYFRERNMAAVVFTVDWEAQSGIAPIPNEEIAEAAAANPDVLIPFASVDPSRPDAVERARRLIADHDVKGFKFHPNLQAFFPNDRSAYPLYETIAEARLPALFHTGHSGMGTGVPGGGGFRLKYSNPMCLDDVAADFPDLQVVLAHPSFPWQDEAISVCLHKENVWIDLSGWSPKYFSPQLVQYANTQLRSKVLFGSDFPLLTPDRWLADFEQAPFKDEVRPLILKENAARLLGLQPEGSTS